MVAAIEQFFLVYAGLTYAIAFLVSFTESLAFVGIFVPGTIIVVIVGFVAEQSQSFHFWWLVALVSFGTFLGNLVSFAIGRYYGPPLFSEKNFYLKRRYLERAQEYFESHGGKSVFTGQFLGPLHSLVSLAAGMAEMPTWPFVLWSAFASVLWSLVHLSLGYFFGASWEAVRLWGTRLSLFVFVLIVIFIVNWIVGRFLVRHERQVRAVVVSIGRSILDGFLSNEHVASFLDRYPRFFGFLRQRFSRRHILGLPLTVAIVASFTILFYFLVVIHAIVTHGPLVGIDQRLFAAVLFARDPLLNPIMLILSNLAFWPVVGIMIAAVYFLWANGRQFRAIVLIAGTAIIGLLDEGLKYLFHRSRPDQGFALVTANTPSFPSGHAVIAVVVYGFIMFAVLRYIPRWRLKILTVLFTVSLVFLIGLSRVYLGVHWPSDVLGGYLLGAWWLTVMVTVSHLAERSFAPPVARRSRPLTIGIVTVALLAAALTGVAAYGAVEPLRTVQRDSIDILPVLTADRFTPDLLDNIPHQTETLGGRSQAPINLVFIGSRETLLHDFARAGWTVADPVDVSTALKTIQTSLANEPYPTAPFSPAFYQGRVQDIGIQKSTPEESVRQRHHVRLWLAPMTFRDGETVWLGTASFDERVAYSPVLRFPTHIISPDIDSERDFIRDELQRVDAVSRQETVRVIQPVLGQTGAGSPFFTDGLAHILWLNAIP